MNTPVFDDYCFACGKQNPRGLKMVVHYVDELRAAEATLALPREYQGWQEIIHGGILATLLDEIMAHAIWHFAGPGITLELAVRYRHPLKPGEPVRVWGCLAEEKKRRFLARGEIVRIADGRLIATGQSRFLLMAGNKQAGSRPDPQARP